MKSLVENSEASETVYDRIEKAFEVNSHEYRECVGFFGGKLVHAIEHDRVKLLEEVNLWQSASHAHAIEHRWLGRGSYDSHTEPEAVCHWLKLVMAALTKKS